MVFFVAGSLAYLLGLLGCGVGLEAFLVALKGVGDGLYAEFYGADGSVFVEVFEVEEGGAGVFDDFFYDGVDGGVVAAFEAGEFEGDEVGVAGDEFGGPDLARAVFGEAVAPDVVDFEGAFDFAGLHFGAEEAFQVRGVGGEALLREDGVAELLEFNADLVVDAGVVVVGPPEHDDAQAVFGFECAEDGARRASGDRLRAVRRPLRQGAASMGWRTGAGQG